MFCLITDPICLITPILGRLLGGPKKLKFMNKIIHMNIIETIVQIISIMLEISYIHHNLPLNIIRKKV